MNVLRIRKDINSPWENVIAIKGDKGEQGIQGIQGEIGPQGPKGDDGTGVTILGSYVSYDELVANHPTGNIGDSYLVDGNLYVWSATENAWVNVGNIKGPKGDPGDQGEQGPQGETGPQGEQGQPGTDGYTPVKGTDYWTEEDKSAMILDVINALEIAEEGVY